MSNLGMYQTLTTIAKKVGGPKNLVCLLVGGGIAIGVGGTKAYEIGKKKVKKYLINRNNTSESSKTIYVVGKEGTSNEGLTFMTGDSFRVLEYDDDAILIEKIGDNHNPHFVDYGFLKSISNYRRDV